MKLKVIFSIIAAIHIFLIPALILIIADSDPTEKKTNSTTQNNLDGGGLNTETPPQITIDEHVKKNDPVGTVGQDPDLGYSIYKVKRGDIGSAIARKHDISWANIKKFNNLTSDNLKVGQKLKIPALQ